MFCSHCGAPATGNYCCHCGGKLAASSERAPPAASEPSADSGVVSVPFVQVELVRLDWTEELHYGALLEHAEVRQRIAAAARRYREEISGEEILALFDAIASPPVSLEKLGKALMPVYSKLGIRTGKSASWCFSLPPGRVLTAVLCSLASHGMTIKQVEQAVDACQLTCRVPSNVWSMSSELVITVRGADQQTIVEANVMVAGQLYDWGKSRSILDHLLAETQAFAA